MPILSRMRKTKETSGDEFIEMVKRAKLLDSQGIEPVLGLNLGRSMKISEMYKAVSNYNYLLQLMEMNRVRGSIIVRMAHIGIDRSTAECFENLKLIIQEAKKTKTFIWLDASSPKIMKSTLQIYILGLSKYKSMGIVLHANLKRTEDDIKKIVSRGAVVCLTMGLESSDAEVSYTRESDINKNYIDLMTFLFKHTDHFAIATHDKSIIQSAIKLNSDHNKDIEFQFFKHDEKLKKKLREQGYKVVEQIRV